MKNRQNENILDNIANWLPIRGRLLSELKSFFYPNIEENEVKENKNDTKRHNERVNTIKECMKEKMALSNAEINDSSFHQELRSFSGQTLDKNKDLLLNSYVKGELYM